MQDKDIDRLFSSKLDNLEVEPSEHVWSGIKSRLDKKKRLLGFYLSIAASLFILLSASLYFASNTTEVVKKPSQTDLAKNNKPSTIVVPSIVKEPKIVEPQVQKVVTIEKSALRKQKTQTVKVEPVIVKEEITGPAPQIAQAAPGVDAPLQVIVPDKSVPFNDKAGIIEEQPSNTRTLVAKPQDNIPVNTLAAAPVKKHRIRNFGDLINAVVSKVDKRKDKLIEFSTTKDEDDATLSGLNLGFIKIKKTEE